MRGDRALGVLGALCAFAYPVGAYVGLTRLSARPFGLALAAALLVVAVLRIRGDRREHAVVAARIPLTLIALLLFGAVLDDRRFVLVLPVLTNAALFAHFAGSLRTMPIAERFARAQHGELPAGETSYCRSVTLVWCAFFVTNGAITGALGLWAPLAWWTLYTGAISYVLVGLLAAAEYTVRKARFRRYGASLADRLLARIFPPEDGVPVAAPTSIVAPVDDLATSEVPK
jgi:uncharacterized membrane protein